MIRWRVQNSVDHPDLAAGRPPAGLLTPQEQCQYDGYLSPRRRRDWLLGRWTAKQLAQAHFLAAEGFRPALDSFTIAYTPSGAPILTSHHPALRGAGNEGRLPLALAISHSGGYAFCALCDDSARKVRVGADIELVETRPRGFVEEFFSAAEQAHLHAAPRALRELLITATWSVKEAALKATQLGLRADPRDVQCIVRPACPRHWMPIRVQMSPALHAQTATEGPLTTWWRVIDNRLRPGTQFVLTLAAFGAEL